MMVAVFTEQFNYDRHEICVSDPKVLKLPLMEWSYRCRPPPLDPTPDFLPAIKQVIESADAFIVISTEYYQTIPPALTNTLIHFDVTTFSGKPAAMVCYSDGTCLRARVCVRASGFRCIILAEHICVLMICTVCDDATRRKLLYKLHYSIFTTCLCT